MQNVLFDLSQTKRKQKPKICCKGTTFYPNHQILENNFEGSLYPDASTTNADADRFNVKTQKQIIQQPKRISILKRWQ